MGLVKGVASGCQRRLAYFRWYLRASSSITALPWFEDDAWTEVGHVGDSRRPLDGVAKERPKMTGTNKQGQISELDAFVGEWAMTASSAPAPAEPARARTVFEWLNGKRFLAQRWEVEHPEAPDGIAIIGLPYARVR